MSYMTLSIKEDVKKLMKDMKGDMSYGKFIEEQILGSKRVDDIVKNMHEIETLKKNQLALDKRLKDLERIANPY